MEFLSGVGMARRYINPSEPSYVVKHQDHRTDVTDSSFKEAATRSRHAFANRFEH